MIQWQQFQSTRPLRGATARARRPGATAPISIHAPLAGCDVRRTLCLYLKDSPFQSTHPLRGATGSHALFVQQGRISIHAPLAGRDRRWSRTCSRWCYFNPRTPCGARHGCVSSISAMRLFQSTRPLRGATGAAKGITAGQAISIHAPLAGRDMQCRGTAFAGRHFNPRAPCGARRCFGQFYS